MIVSCSSKYRQFLKHHSLLLTTCPTKSPESKKPTKKNVPGQAEEESIDDVPHLAAHGTEINASSYFMYDAHMFDAFFF